MIKFFRKIRQKLLTENKFSKYLLYAMGEIILVVLGILIALNLNNLNEIRKANKHEIMMLINLNKDLNKNLVELRSYKEGTQSRYQCAITILNYLDQKKQIDDTLKNCFELLPSFDMCNIWSTTYKYIENQGASSMHNDSLRLKITEMYDRSFWNVTFREKDDIEKIDNFLKPQLYQLFKSGRKAFANDSDRNPVRVNTPVDYHQLQHNQEFKNVILDLQGFLNIRIFRQEETIQELENLIIELEGEIERLVMKVS